jgi:tRNA pseudouridine38-40 synthase
MRFFIELSYNGKAYHGWQNQPNAITVQEVVEGALSTLLKEDISIVGAGRTDTGVHALQMFAHFDYNHAIDCEQLQFKMNAFLPRDISVHNIFNVVHDAHARFDAKSRTYIYKLTSKKNAFSFDGTCYVKQQLDLNKMNEAAKYLYTYKNFKSFSRSNTDVKTYNCDIKKAVWEERNDEYVFTIQADRFLRNMVRAIVGTLLDIGKGKMKVDQFKTIIESEDRVNAGASAPAHALYLSRIEYPESILSQ